MLRQRPKMSEEAYRDKMRAKGFNDEGVFIPDSVPMEPPIGFVRSPPLFETIRDMVRHEQLQKELRDQGLETLEESDDFDVPDDPFPASQYEVDDDLEPIGSLREKAAKAEEEEKDDTSSLDKHPPEQKGEGDKRGSRTKSSPAKRPSPKDQPEDDTSDDDTE